MTKMMMITIEWQWWQWSVLHLLVHHGIQPDDDDNDDDDDDDVDDNDMLFTSSYIMAYGLMSAITWIISNENKK